MPAGRGSATERRRAANTEQQDEPHSGTWNCVILLHWCTGLSGFVYVIWRYANDKANTSLPNEMRQDFRPSPYGFGRKQDMSSLDWQIERSFVLATWNWLLIHPLLARLTAYAAPTLLPIFYTVYSALFVTALLGVEVAAVIVILHALFIIVASLRAPILCYAAALVVLLLKFSMSDSFRQLLYFRYGTLGYVVIMAIVQWTLLRCLSFSLDFIYAGCKARHQTAPGPPYWKTLAYVLYLPPLYLGPMQNYSEFESQVEKPRPNCTLWEIAAVLGRLTRSGIHFLLVEGFTHYFYSSALSHRTSKVEKLSVSSLLGYGLALYFFFFLRYVFCYGFAGSLARAEGVELPPHSKCIARMHRCSHFWRYFDRGMHLWIRKYVYNALVGERKGAFWMLFGTATAFGFSWLWHGMDEVATIWSVLSIAGIATEILAAEAWKTRPVRNFELKYLTTPQRTRVAEAVLGAPHYLLTLCACIFHLADMDVCIILCRRILLGFPSPPVSVLVVLYTGCFVAPDIMKWEAAAKSRRKEASS